MSRPAIDLPFPLPNHLAERCTVLESVSSRDRGAGDLVVAWLHHAARLHDNPVLDVAIEAACEKNLPLVVHAGFAGHHDFANDRQTVFMLEGWAELQSGLRARGILMSITPPANGGPSGLRKLAARAAVLVAEDHPRRPYPSWTRSIADVVPGTTITVDAACVLPGRLVKGVHDRAFKFRSACDSGWKSRLRREDPAVEAIPSPARESDLPSDALDLVDASEQHLRDLVGTWPLDHAVGPVPGMRGGESEGLRRWKDFLDRGIDRYHQRRNDAVDDGTSGLSPWLHHGMVSPLRLAREAFHRGGDGPDKFLDELLVWRELSFHFCRTRPDHDRHGAIPAWARQTLEAHRRDARQRRSWETLARGRTGDALWDLAQASLRERGWLHNNLRMTWGKALLEWTADSSEALDRLLDLNDRYALDGRDPNSIGGLLWCLGLFDRPFPEEHEVTGTLRTRPTTVHAKRMDLDRYRDRIRSSIARDRVMVIGAGTAGSMAARTLADHGHEVVLIDKGRGPGGRCSSRRRTSEDGTSVRHDHGCQVFRLRGDLRRELTRSWIEDGVVTRWKPRVMTTEGVVGHPLDEWYVGTTGMNALVSHLQSDLQVRFGTAVATIEHRDDTWHALDETGRTIESAPRIVLAIPSTQALRLLGDHRGELPHQVPDQMFDGIAGVEVDPTWTLMVRGVETDPGFDVAIDPNDHVRWLSREASRPGREDVGAWTMHASPAWTRAHLEEEREEVEPRLRALATELLGVEPAPGAAHRWRFGLTRRPLGHDHLWTTDQRLMVCGDWCLGGRVEHAIESGIAAAGRILRNPDAARVDSAAGTLFGTVA